VETLPDIPSGRTPGTVSPADGSWSAEQLVRLGDLHACADNHIDAIDHYARARARLEASGGSAEALFEVSLRMAESLFARGDTAGAQRTLDELLAGPLSGSPHRPRAIGLSGLLAVATGRYEEATSRIARALEDLVTSGLEERTLAARLRLGLGQALERQGDTEGAAREFERALHEYRALGDDRGVAHAYNNLGLNLKQRHRFREAIALLHRALEQLDGVGDYGRKAPTCLNLGITYVRLGEWRQARVHLLRAVQISRELDHEGRLVKALLGLALLQLRCREFEAAAQTVTDAEELACQHDYRREQILVLELRGELAVTTGRAGEGAAILEAALERAVELAPRSDINTEILRRLAEAYLALGRLGEAEDCATRAIAMAEALGDRTELAASHRVRAVVAAMTGDTAGAGHSLDAALSTFREIGARDQEARTHLDAVRGLLRRPTPPDEAETARAEEHLCQAKSLFETLEVPGYLAEVFQTSAEIRLLAGRIDDAERALRAAARYVEATEEPALHERQLESFTRLDQAKAAAGSIGDPDGTRATLHRFFQSGAEPEQAMDHLLAAACRNTGSDRAFLASSSEARALEVLRASGTTPEAARALLESARGACERALENRLPAIHVVPRAEGSVAFAVAPLCLPRGTAGVLYVDRTPEHGAHPYGSRELKLLALLSEFATISVLSNERRVMLEASQILPASRELVKRLKRPIVHQSRAMAEVLATAAKVASSSASVLIRGETGSGKGLVAEAVHELGPRRGLPFVHVNCAALPETLLESELFGHVPGAFTGALGAKQGLFLEAAAGTIFLDEIDKTSRVFQSKLLHVLDRRHVRPVGSAQWTPMAARVLAATNADLHALIARGEFLEDLYYRLNDIGLVVPPLRERVEDIPCLFAHFLAAAACDASKCTPGRSAEVSQALARYAWPGNVRELENVARRLMVLWGDSPTIELEHLPPEIQKSAGNAPPNAASSLREALGALERRMIRDAMTRHRGNKSAVARELGLSYPTLLAKVRLYGV